MVVKKTTDDAALSRKIVNKVCALKVDFDWLIASWLMINPLNWRPRSMKMQIHDYCRRYNIIILFLIIPYLNWCSNLLSTGTAYNSFLVIQGELLSSSFIFVDSRQYEFHAIIIGKRFASGGTASSCSKVHCYSYIHELAIHSSYVWYVSSTCWERQRHLQLHQHYYDYYEYNSAAAKVLHVNG